MRILLDENFPLALHRNLVRDGLEAEHLVLGTQRGGTDREILARLEREAVLFITQDTDFLQNPPPGQSIIIVSRIPQWIGLAERVDSWRRAIDGFLADRPKGRIFELVLPGVLHSVA